MNTVPIGGRWERFVMEVRPWANPYYPLLSSITNVQVPCLLLCTQFRQLCIVPQFCVLLLQLLGMETNPIQLPRCCDGTTWSLCTRSWHEMMCFSVGTLLTFSCKWCHDCCILIHGPVLTRQNSKEKNETIEPPCELAKSQSLLCIRLASIATRWNDSILMYQLALVLLLKDLRTWGIGSWFSSC